MENEDAHEPATGPYSRSLDSSVVQRWATDWMMGGFDSRQELGIPLFTTASRSALGPILPPIQWVPGALSLGVKRPRREADHSPPSSAEVKECVELFLHSPNTPSWRDAKLKHKDNFILLLLLLLFGVREGEVSCEGWRERIHKLILLCLIFFP
jgi:hypothetical protein